MSIGTITAVNDTWLKSAPVPVGELTDDKKVLCKKGTELELKWIVDEVEKGHRKVDLEVRQNARFSWYVYLHDWEVNESEHPKLSEFEIPVFKGKQVTIPGLGLRYLDQPIIKNFTYGEMFHGDTRIPRSGDLYPGLTPEAVVNNIIKVTKKLEAIRSDFGDRPITINSGYRPPSVNRAVGGASQSRHLWGDAVDFNIKGVHPRDIYNKYDRDFIGGLAWSNHFLHIDMRGYNSRWRYPH